MEPDTVIDPYGRFDKGRLCFQFRVGKRLVVRDSRAVVAAVAVWAYDA